MWGWRKQTESTVTGPEWYRRHSHRPSGHWTLSLKSQEVRDAGHGSGQRQRIQPRSDKVYQVRMELTRDCGHLQHVSHLMWRASSLEKTLMLGQMEGRRRRGWQRMRRLDGIPDSMDMGLSKIQETVMDREAWGAVGPGVTKSQTRLSDGRAATVRDWRCDRATSPLRAGPQVPASSSNMGPGR